MPLPRLGTPLHGPVLRHEPRPPHVRPRRLIPLAVLEPPVRDQDLPHRRTPVVVRLTGSSSFSKGVARAESPAVAGLSVSSCGSAGPRMQPCHWHVPIALTGLLWNSVAMHIDGVPNRTSRPTYLLRERLREPWRS